MPPGFKDVELVGDVARLRPIEARDAASAFELLQDDRIISQLVWDGPDSPEALVEGYQERAGDFAAGNKFHFAIERIGIPGMIGDVALDPMDNPLQFHVGYWLGVPYWGQGVMTDATRLAVHFAFTHLVVARVSTGVFPGNIGSQRVLEKCGFSHDGVLRYNTFKRGEWKDSLLYCMTRPEWEGDEERFAPTSERVVAA